MSTSSFALPVDCRVKMEHYKKKFWPLQRLKSLRNMKMTVWSTWNNPEELGKETAGIENLRKN